MELNVNVPAMEKLIDYTASGIGSVAGHLLATRIARREVEVQKILAEGQADTMQIIAKAQAEARELLVRQNATVQGELTIGDFLTQRIQFQEEKRQANISTVVNQAVLELGDKNVQDHEVDHDWTARFFNDVQDVSSKEMQTLWAKILAGEVERPGSASIKTLGTLKNFDQAIAKAFQTLCSICITTWPYRDHFLHARVLFPGNNTNSNALTKYGLGFERLIELNAHGLISSEHNYQRSMRTSIRFDTGGEGCGPVRIPFGLQGKYWGLVPTAQTEFSKDFRVPGLALTRSGEELLRVVELEPAKRYLRDLKEHFRASNLEMTEVGAWEYMGDLRNSG